MHTFVCLSTQWRIAPSGHLVGLDYAALPAVLDLGEVPRDRRAELFAALRVMEAAALDDMSKRHGH